jgi:hypothetical protein
MNFKKLTIGKTLLAGSLLALAISCNSSSTTTDTPQQDAKDSVVKENKKVDLKPTGPAPA